MWTRRGGNHGARRLRRWRLPWSLLLSLLLALSDSCSRALASPAPAPAAVAGVQEVLVLLVCGPLRSYAQRPVQHGLVEHAYGSPQPLPVVAFLCSDEHVTPPLLAFKPTALPPLPVAATFVEHGVASEAERLDRCAARAAAYGLDAGFLPRWWAVVRTDALLSGPLPHVGRLDDRAVHARVLCAAPRTRERRRDGYVELSEDQLAAWLPPGRGPAPGQDPCCPGGRGGGGGGGDAEAGTVFDDAFALLPAGEPADAYFAFRPSPGEGGGNASRGVALSRHLRALGVVVQPLPLRARLPGEPRPPDGDPVVHACAVA